ncbi:MAG: response regulator [Nitrospirae bacterium]|nr:response regulator [Nitrospirota bacterium]
MERSNNAVILIVDDDIAVLESTAELLREFGYSTINFANAKDAITKLKENGSGVDVVLSDIRMPGISGIELLEEIRSLNTDVPVILMTAHAEPDTAISAMAKGAFDFLIKPCRPDLLVRSIEMAVKHKRH